MEATAQERQLTFSAKNHNLDNNDNFSPDGRYLCYDTREMLGPGIENSQSVEMIELATGKETILLGAGKSITGAQAAPGIGAVSFSFVEDTVAFIHGPPLEDVPVRGYYAKPNRNGAAVDIARAGVRYWLDKRDVATDRDTTPGAHRGGTHRHEFSRDGKRIGFTYDDFLLPQYDRTIGYMERHPRAPEGAACYFALLVPVVPKDTSGPGEIEKAYADSWVDPAGTMRAFIGKVRTPDGATYEESLFVVDIPAGTDITTAFSGPATRYPAPPKGVSVRRLTQAWAGGIVRASHDGKRIAYYGKADDGTTQIFLIPSDGSDRHINHDKRPVQATRFPGGAGVAVRWHPSGNFIACISDNAVAVTCVEPGPNFGVSAYLTPRGDGPPERLNLVWSPDGSVLAYNKAVPTLDAAGQRVTTYDGSDCLQVFAVAFPR